MGPPPAETNHLRTPEQMLPRSSSAPAPDDQYSTFVSADPLSLETFHVNGIIQYTAFCAWLLSLSTEFSRFIHFVAWIGTSHIFRAEYSMVWISHISFMHLSTGKHLGSFPPLAITSYTTTRVIPLPQYCTLQRLYLPHFIVLAAWSKIHWPYIWGYISELSIQFYSFIWLSLCQHHATLITVAMYCIF